MDQSDLLTLKLIITSILQWVQSCCPAVEWNNPLINSSPIIFLVGYDTTMECVFMSCVWSSKKTSLALILLFNKNRGCEESRDGYKNCTECCQDMSMSEMKLCFLNALHLSWNYSNIINIQFCS